jgi:serine/threonine protein kinase
VSAASDDGRDPVERLAEAFLARRRGGETLAVDAFAGEHPEHAERIRALFPLLLAIEDEVPPDPLAARATVGPYSIERELGRGGAGVVYLAVDGRLGRRVALKVLADGPLPSPDALARLRREAQAASRVEHAGLCPVYDVGDVGGRPYIAFRHIPGESLARRIRRRRAAAEDGAGPTIDAEELGVVLRVVEDAARALHAAHASGLVHRDVKPGNVMVTPQGDGVVLDFGLAQADDPAATDAATRTGLGAGTPAYMAPEQLTLPADGLDARVDVYGLGATLYEALTLAPPFEAPTLSALFDAIRRQEPAPVSRRAPLVPRDVEAVVEVAMAKDRGMRYASAAAFADDLARARRGEPVHARPPGPVGRLARWARRNPAVASSVAGAFAALASGLAVSLSLLASERSALDAEEAARAAARGEALAAVSAEAGRTDAMLGLLLAREAVRTARTPQTSSRLQAALEASLERRRLPARGRDVVSLALDASGGALLEGDDAGAFVRHDLSAGTSTPVEAAGARPGPARACGFVAGGPLAYVVDAAGAVRLVGPDGRVRAALFDGAPARSVDARSRGVGVLALLEDGRLLAADPADPARVRAFAAPVGADGRAAAIESARTRPSDAGVLAALPDASVVVFDRDGGVRGVRREAARRGSGPVVLLDDDAFARLVTGPSVGEDDVAPEILLDAWRVWHVSGKPLRDLQVNTLDPGASPPAPWSGRGVRGVVGIDGAVRVDPAASGIQVTLDTPRDVRVERVVVSEDGTRLLTVRALASRNLGESTDAAPLRLWTPVGNRLGALHLGAGRVTTAAFSPDGHVLAVATGGAPTAVCATSPAGLMGEAIGSNASRLRQRRRPVLTDEGRAMVMEVEEHVFACFSMDGRERARWSAPELRARVATFDAPWERGPLAASEASGLVSLATPEGEPLKGWKDEGQVDRIGWLRGGDRLVVSALGDIRTPIRDERGDPYVRIRGGFVRWRRPDGTLVAERKGRLVESPAASNPRADRVVVELEDGSFEVDDRDGKPVATMPAMPGHRPGGVDVSADGRRVLLRFYPDVVDARLLGAVRLHDGTTGALLCEAPMLAPSWGVTAALRPDGPGFLVARPDGATVLVDERGRPTSPSLSREGVSVFSVAFDPSAERLAIGYEDGSLDVRTMSGAPVFSLPPREGAIYASFTPDGRRLVTSTIRGAVAMWTFDVDEALALADSRVTRGLTDVERERYVHLLGPPAPSR